MISSRKEIIGIMGKERIWNHILTAATAAVLAAFLAILLVCQIFGGVYRTLNVEQENEELADGWFQLLDNGERRDFSFPADYEASDGERIVLEHTMEPSQGDTLKLQFLHLTVEVFLDGQLLYAYGDGELPFSHTTARTVHFVSLPENFAGKTLQVVLTPCLEGTEVYRISTPLIGTVFSILADMISMEGWAVAGAVMLVFFGICIILLGLFVRKLPKITDQTVYLGIFSMTAGIFCFFETELALLLTNNPYSVHTGDGVALQVICLPIYGLFYTVCRGYFPRLVKFGFLYGVLNFVIQNMLNFMGWDYRYFAVATHMGIVFCIVMALLILGRAVKRKDREALRFILRFVPLIVFTVPELVNFYWIIPFQGFFFEFGIFIFVVLQLRSIGQSVLQNYQQAAKSQMYEKLAMTDYMTKLKNRTAYERRIYEYKEQAVEEDIYCVMVDINNLKKVNDTYGHEKGDLLILETVSALQDAFREHGEIYRIGGDEFAVILSGLTSTAMEELCQTFRGSLRSRSAVCSFPVDAAIGYSRFRKGEDQSLEETFLRADDRMYEDKRSRK